MLVNLWLLPETFLNYCRAGPGWPQCQVLWTVGKADVSTAAYRRLLFGYICKYSMHLLQILANIYSEARYLNDLGHLLRQLTLMHEYKSLIRQF